MKKELIFSSIGYACLLVVGGVLGLWIYLSTRTEPFVYDTVKQEYYSYFPTVLSKGGLLDIICIAVAALGILSLRSALKYISSKAWRGINIVAIVLLGLLVFMNLWSLM